MLAIPGFDLAHTPEAQAAGTQGSAPFAEGKDGVASEAKPLTRLSTWTYGHVPGARSQVRFRPKSIVTMLCQGWTRTTPAGDTRPPLNNFNCPTPLERCESN